MLPGRRRGSLSVVIEKPEQVAIGVPIELGVESRIVWLYGAFTTPKETGAFLEGTERGMVVIEQLELDGPVRQMRVRFVGASIREGFQRKANCLITDTSIEGTGYF